jgi:hypothetical protein
MLKASFKDTALGLVIVKAWVKDGSLIIAIPEAFEKNCKTRSAFAFWKFRVTFFFGSVNCCQAGLAGGKLSPVLNGFPKPENGLWAKPHRGTRDRTATSESLFSIT